MPETQSAPSPMVVGIGASAGGLSALKELFSRMPGETGMIFVVVMHLSPEHHSHLADLLQPYTRMPVIQITDTLKMEPDHVYVIPPGRNLSTIDTHLRLSDLEAERSERAPIDHFLITLAHAHGEQAIAIILSGTGADGSLGMKMIKEAGGLTVVQDPKEAEFDGMPQNAILTGLIDLVLPLGSMPDSLQRFARTRPRIALLEAADAAPDTERQALQNIFAQLRARTGQDFSRYKRSTVLRRLRRRMQLHQLERLEDYLTLLRDSPEEVRQLGNDFLITVTQFFRDTEAFAYLEQDIIPTLFAGKGPEEQVRVWSVGCATGEEAYSLAILLREYADSLAEAPELQVFASDLHEHSLKRAREGVYPDNIAGDVSPERLQRFFTREDSSYRIRNEVREMVVFAAHNLLRDPPFSHVDLIVCRNLLIYLQREAQHDVFDLFHYALNPDGLMMLGSSETVDRTGLFRAENKRLGIYRRRSVPPPEPRLPVFLSPLRRERTHGVPFLPRNEPVPSYGSLHQKIVERYALPSILVNQEHQVVHISEHAGRYLQVSGGDPSTSLFKLAREELRLELRTALQTAMDSGRDLRTKPIELQLEGETRRVIIHVRPSRGEDIDGFYLVIFDEMEAAEAPAVGSAEGLGDARQKTELDDARAQLRAIIEQYETSQEEMTASNEELQSTNEELRSAMEELETSREELQSMNEELQTANQENRNKVEELGRLTSDLNNLIAATEIAILFLDKDLRILRVTPRVGDLFNVRSGDHGRPLTDFTNRLGYSDLPDDARRVLERLVPVEREVQSQAGDWYLMRILPYRNEDRIQGVVVTFIEITERKQAELALRESEESFRALVSASAQIVWSTDAQGQVVEDSPSWRAFTGQTVNEWLGSGWEDAIHPEDRDQVLAAWRQSIAQQVPLEHEFRLRHVSGEWRWTHVKAVPLCNEAGRVRGWIGMNTDVTTRMQADALKQEDKHKDEFLALLGHELRNPLAPMRIAVDLFKKLLPDDSQLQNLCEILDVQVFHLTRLVDDLLDVSRIKSGRITLQLQSMDARDTVREAAASMKWVLESQQQSLKVEQTAEPLPVQADATRLVQVLINLLDNAGKFTAEGGQIELISRRAGDQAELCVSDNGAGMSQEMLSRVFETFKEGGSHRTDSRSGLGLGLMLARRLIEMHEGSIEACSEGPGRGSTFIIRLPLAPSAAAGSGRTRTAGDRPRRSTAPEATAAPNTGRRILIVDDNQDAADALALMLQSAGHEVRKAYTGQRTLELVEDYAPETVILDIGLPDMDGYTLARRLRRHPNAAEAEFIAVTGYSQDRDRIRSADAGIEHHLVKPVETSVLLDLIADMPAPA